MLDTLPADGLVIPENPHCSGLLQRRFDGEVAKHQMTVLKDDGLYRHLAFRDPEHSGYWFEITTWPGHLAIDADMGSFVFARDPDMFEWFGTGTSMNFDYWTQKAIAVDRNNGLREHSLERFGDEVMRRVVAATRDLPQGDRQLILDDVFTEVVATEEYATQYEEGAREAILDYRFRSAARPGLGFTFDPDIEWDFEEHSTHFRWACHAIKYGIRQYRGMQAAAVVTTGE